jgi:hypothetical protein
MLQPHQQLPVSTTLGGSLADTFTPAAAGLRTATKTGM